MAPKRTNLATQRRQPRQERSRDLVSTILLAAAQVLEAHGYDESTTNRIAAKAGVSIGSLYQYFPNKEALVGALMTEIMDGARAVFDRGVAGAEPALPPTKGADPVIDAMVRRFYDKAKLMRILLDDVPARVRRQGQLKNRLHFMKLLEGKIQESGGFGGIEPKTAAFVIVHSIIGSLHGTLLAADEIAIAPDALSLALTRLVTRFVAEGP